MKTIVTTVLMFVGAVACGQDGRQHVSAQAHAQHLAATGTFAHCSRRGGGYEGIGMSSVSPEAAMRNCCFWGQRRVREIGTAWSAAKRMWIAVVRYD